MIQVIHPGTLNVSSRAWKILGATSLTNFVVGLDLSITNVAIPDMGREFTSASTADLSWVLTFYMVTFAGFLIVAGRWADRYGRLRMLNIGIACLVIGAALASIAPSLVVLIAMRGLQGIGAAMMAPASLGLAVAAWPVERRGTAVAVWSSTLALSTAVGPVAGGFLIEYGSWRWAYALEIPVGLIALVWGVRVLSESARHPETHHPDLVGAALLGAATGGLALAIVQGQEWGWASPAVLGLLVFCAVSIIMVTRRTATHRDPIVPRTLLAVSSFRIASTSLFLFGLGFFSMLLAVVLYLTEIAGYSTVTVGIAIITLPIAALVSANVSGPLADRFGFRAVVIPGMLLFTVGALWLGVRAGPSPNYLLDLFPGFLLAGTGIGAGPAILNGAGVSEVDPAHFSVAGAVTQTARQLAGAIGVAILVAILGASASGSPTVGTFRWAFVFLASAAVLASLVATRLPARTSAA
ncbi:MFS transporter [Candidatus Poriferisodalis sp.]|uniref:MFS transporter n=1 Tax=Candidatus Poriferisodalis sp. TaxID=3101277 RepID=UPI003D0F46C8